MASTTFIVHWLCERLTESARFIIYALMDPRTGEYRYIGKSSKGTRRAKDHEWYVRKEKEVNTYKRNWIHSLLREGLQYEIVILEEVDGEDLLDEKEMHWIAWYRNGHKRGRLTNLTDGGDGLTNPSPETRARMSAKAKRPENIARLLKMTASCSAEDWRKRALAREASLSDEQKRARSERAKTQLTPEERKKLASAGGRAVQRIRTPEQYKAIAQKMGQTRRKIWGAMSAEERRQKTAHLNAVPMSAEQRKILAAAGGRSSWGRLSEEERKAQIERMQTANARLLTGERRSALRRAECARMTSEQRSERSRKAMAKLSVEEKRDKALKAWTTRRAKALPRLRINLLPQEASS